MKCIYCDKEFKAYRKFHKYCSNRCMQRYYNDIKRNTICACGCNEKCLDGHTWKAGHKSKIDNYFTGKNKTGEEAWHYKGGKRKRPDGYLEILSNNHPNKTKDGYVLEHRLVMEKHIKRYLTKEEIVHHIDENKSNNSIDNLELLSSRSEHSKLHHRKIIKCVGGGVVL